MRKLRLTKAQKQMRKRRTKEWRQANKKQNITALFGTLFLAAFIKDIFHKED